MNTHDTISALAPAPTALESDWSTRTLTTILQETQEVEAPSSPRRRFGKRSVALLVSGAIALSAGTAVAGDGAVSAVREAILDFANQPNTTGNGLGTLDEPVLVAQFDIKGGLFSFWVATSTTNKVCFASSDGAWDGRGTPTKAELEYGCVEEALSPENPNRIIQVTRPDQLGGFFKDSEPLIYGISPFASATTVHLQGTGVDRTLPLRDDSHGFGAALPEAGGAKALTLTFIDASGSALGSTRWVAPVG